MGSSGVSVSALTLGTMTFGAESPAEESLAMLDTYVEAGGNVIDTADVYADGVSEEIVGEWLRSRPQEITREMVLATKGRFPTSALGGSLRASRRHLRRALTESLRRLRSITSTSTSCTPGIPSPRSRRPWTSWTGRSVTA